MEHAIEFYTDRDLTEALHSPWILQERHDEIIKEMAERVLAQILIEEGFVQ